MARAKKDSDFRYNTGESRVPWAAVGENYNQQDVMEVVKFLMQGDGAVYDARVESVREAVSALAEVSTPPAKLSLDVEVAKCEKKAAEYVGIDDCVFLTNCTAGFEIAYKYVNLQPGDEVIVPAITFIATMAYPLSVGAKVVFCDVDPRTLNMDPDDLAKKITNKTKMVVPVHIGGYPCDMDRIMDIAHTHGALVLEDAAHGFGAKYKGRNIGAIADFTSFSFHEVKNNTSFGEGGILMTTVPEFKSSLRRARFLGVDFSMPPIKDWLYNVAALPGKYGPVVAGNASTTEIQALGLSLQIDRYGKILEERARCARYVTQRLQGVPGVIPQDLGAGGTVPTFHLYQLQIDPAELGGDIQVFKKKLTERGVTNIPHFGPLYRFQILQELGYDADAIAATCPNTEEVFYHRFTHLPIYGLTAEQLDYMIQAIKETAAEMRGSK